MANAPVSKVDVCQLSVDLLGGDDISSIDTPLTDQEKVCARWYDAVREALLRAYPWNFAVKFRILTKSTTEIPPYRYNVAFALPNDWLRVLEIGDRSTTGIIQEYDISGRFIYIGFADSGSDPTELKLKYIRDEQIVRNFDALFIQLLAHRLAKRIAYKFTLKNTVIKRIDEELKILELQAAAVDGQERPPRRIQRSRWRQSRRRISNVAGPIHILER